MKRLPIMEKRCATCPFRKGGYEEVRGLLEERALGVATPICHSTGTTSIVPKSKRVRTRQHLCRGARDFQLMIFFRIGFLSAPTDEAWEAKFTELK